MGFSQRKVIKRRQHYTDLVDDIDPRKRRRTIKNWANRKRPGGQWEEATVDAQPVTDAPPGWGGGAFEPTLGAFGANLGIGAGDRTNGANRSLWALRREDDPSVWLNWQVRRALIGGTWTDPTNSEPTRVNANTLQWTGLWAGVDATLSLGSARAKWSAVFPVGNYPSEIEYTIKIPGAPASLAIDATGAIVFTRAGEEKLRILAPHVHDSDPAGDPIVGGKVLPSSWEDRGTVQGNRLFVLLVDLSGAVGNVTVDPTATISGTSDLEDNWISSSNVHQLNGTNADTIIGFTSSGSRVARWLLRVAGGAIPAGTLTAARVKFTRISISISSNAGDLDVYTLQDSAAWVENDSDWNEIVHSASIAWPGGVGGKPIDAVAIGTLSYGAYTSGPDVPLSIPISDITAFTAWRDATRTVNGMRINARDEATQNLVYLYSTEGGTPPTVEIDYTEASAIPLISTITPNEGPTVGGTAVAILGDNFTDVSDVTFDGISATSIVEVDDENITCATPANPLGPASVIVTTPLGSNAANSEYTYRDARLNAVLMKHGIIASSAESFVISQATILPTLQEILDDCGRLYQYVTFSGVGALYNGVPLLEKYSSAVPPGGDASYKPWLAEYPGQLEEEVNLLGGRTHAGEVEVRIIDGDQANKFALTTLFVDGDVANVSELSEDFEIAHATLKAPTGTLTANQLFWVDQEVIFLGTLDSTVAGVDIWNVTTRGTLGTLEATHKAGRKIFDRNFFTNSKRIRMYYGAYRSGVSAEQEIASSWILDHKALALQMLAYVFRGKSQETFLDRRMFTIFDDIQGRYSGADLGQVTALLLTDYMEGPNGTWFILNSVASPVASYVEVWPDDFRFYLIEDEIVGSSIASGANVSPQFLGEAEPVQRGIAGTKEAEHDGTETPLFIHEVFVADADLTNLAGTQVGSFRYLYDPAGAVHLEDRTSALAVVTDHPVPITLMVMLSSFSADDNLEMNNNDLTWEFSTLPVGIGIGIPIANIDLDSAIRVWDRTKYLRSPHTVIGRTKDQTFTEWFEAEFGWTRIVMRVSEGKWRFDILALELADATTELIDDSSILTIDAPHGGRTPDMQPEQALEWLASRITYRFKTRDGEDATVNYTEKDFAEVLDQAGHYSTSERAIVFDAPGLRLDDYQGSLMVMPFALSLLLRLYKPIWKVPLRLPIGWDLRLTAGDSARLTNELLPKEGSRGWIAEQVAINKKVTRISPQGVYTQILALSFGLKGNYGRISAAGRVVSVALNGSDYEITISLNKYTDPFAGGDVPTTDVGAFVGGEGYRLLLVDRYGVKKTATVQKIKSVTPGTNLVTVDGNFSGQLTIGVGNLGDIIEFAEYDSTVAAQKAAYVAIGDDDGIGSGNAELWNFAEF